MKKTAAMTVSLQNEIAFLPEANYLLKKFSIHNSAQQLVVIADGRDTCIAICNVAYGNSSAICNRGIYTV